MIPKATSVTICTSQLKECRAFYRQHFHADAIFDCGWYVVLRLGGTEGAPEVCLMEPREGMPAYSGGVTLNLRYDDADVIHECLAKAGLTPVVPLENHPWGDRGFGVIDPAGVMVYCYHPIAPSAEFAPFFTERSGLGT